MSGEREVKMIVVKSWRVDKERLKWSVRWRGYWRSREIGKEWNKRDASRWEDVKYYLKETAYCNVERRCNQHTGQQDKTKQNKTADVQLQLLTFCS